MASNLERLILLSHYLSAGIRGILFKLLKLYSSLIHFLLTAVSPPFIFPASQSSLPYRSILLVSLQKSAGLPGIHTRTWHNMLNKTMHKPSNQAWTRQPSEKKSQEQAKESELTPTPIIRSLTRTPRHTTITYIEDLAQTQTDSVVVASVSVSPNELCLDDSMGCVLVDHTQLYVLLRMKPRVHAR